MTGQDEIEKMLSAPQAFRVIRVGDDARAAMRVLLKHALEKGEDYMGQGWSARFVNDVTEKAYEIARAMDVQRRQYVNDLKREST